METLDRITHDPSVMGGRACIRGMRVTVSLVVNLVASCRTTDEITEAYPYLEPEDICQALKYAARLVSEEDLPLEPADKPKDAEVTGRLNELYSQESSSLGEAVAQMQGLSLPREDW